jgi:hypothetical protein
VLPKQTDRRVVRDGRGSGKSFPTTRSDYLILESGATHLAVLNQEDPLKWIHGTRAPGLSAENGSSLAGAVTNFAMPAELTMPARCIARSAASRKLIAFVEIRPPQP